ncbi:hypothetical protein [Rhodococcus tukisamuensis]|uniref:hypothetical protein n=1 Tax=Rhodococcus tukisamuensis TaxID=168276 RepID=UPI00111396C6|nr:hypothetical protein [Rhodococcus tukisamuensis]
MKPDQVRKPRWWCAVIAVVLGTLTIVLSTISLERTGWTAAEFKQNCASAAIALINLVLGGIGAVAGFAATRPGVRGRYAVGTFAAAVLLVVLLVAVGTHKQAELGTLPTWLSAFGAVFTAGGVLLALTSYRTQQRANLEDQANQARMIRISYFPGPIKDGKKTWWMTVHNASTDPVFDINIRAFRSTADDGKPIAMRAIEETPLGEIFITTAGRTNQRKLDAEAEFKVLWTAAGDDEKVPTAVCQFTLMDAKGRFWLVTDHYEPEKISKPVRPEAEQRKSAGWAKS